jgi:hypothetical protein
MEPTHPIHRLMAAIGVQPPSWPIIRTIKAAKENNFQLTIPFIGEIVNIGGKIPPRRLLSEVVYSLYETHTSAEFYESAIYP